MLATVSAFAFSPAQPNVRDWATHGQIADVDATGLVLDDTMIASINNDPASTWTAGRNTNFEGATLLDAKKIQGTLCKTLTSPSSR